MYTYLLVANRRSYTLPNKNLHLVEEMERVARVDSIHGMTTREKFEEILKFIVDVVGEDNAKEILGSVSVEEVDLSAVTVTFRMIVDAYNKPITDYTSKKSSEALSGIPSEKIGQVIKLMEAAKAASDDRSN